MKWKSHPRTRRTTTKSVLRLPDLEHAKAAVLNSLTSPDAQRGYRHAIDEFVDWYCSEPRLAFNRIVVLRYRAHLESRQLAPGTINLRLGAVRRLANEAADCGLLASAVIRFFEICADCEDSAVDAGFRFAVKKRPVVELLEHEPLIDTGDHLASLLACGVETEVHQDNERIEGDKVPLRPVPVTGRRLEGEKLRSPTLGCNARPLGSNLIGGRIGEVLHDLPADRRI
jgi:hypothetical protein